MGVARADNPAVLITEQQSSGHSRVNLMIGIIRSASDREEDECISQASTSRLSDSVR
jgi:hypothetical protein